MHVHVCVCAYVYACTRVYLGIRRKDSLSKILLQEGLSHCREKTTQTRRIQRHAAIQTEAEVSSPESRILKSCL